MSLVTPLHIQPAAPPSEGQQASLQRHLQSVRVLRPGLHLHADDTADVQDFTASGDMETGLRLVVLLEGAVDVSYGPRRVALSSTAAPRVRTPGQPRGLLVSVAQTERFERRAKRGTYARRVSVGLGGDWLEQLAGASGSGAVEAFRRQHLAMHHWQPSARIAAVAEQITHAPDLSPLLLHLYLESRALELAGEALASLAQHAPGPVPAPAPTPVAAGLRLLPHEHQRMRALHAFLQTDSAMDMSLDALARQAGTNANTLQRHFRAVYGTTVFDFVREHRLQRARLALEHDGMSVGQAALVAGYNSAANFATAYRRRFGLPPKLSRGRV
ncbi:helix-turn-helix transcriptional regulator [Paracidovorax sp. MALMAid1276]|uniref:helix-turn-helix transcriptional regulator n=1 Tax=Paracidovorax sp. MALMAid1276 TaxID=3411631 RepID=UPI003B9A8A6B